MPNELRNGLVGLALLATGLAWSGGAAAAIFNFNNNGVITIPGTGTRGPAVPFPSVISVTGITAVTDVDVTLLGLSHTFSRDLEIVLEGPTGLRVALLVDAGDNAVWTDDDVTFSDGSPAVTPSSPGNSGTFAPTGPGGACGVTLAAPLPQCAGAGSLLSVFNAVIPSGDWKLYINDDDNLDAGNLGRGWRLTFNATIVESSTAIPEPITLAILGVGLAGLGWLRRVTV